MDLSFFPSFSIRFRFGHFCLAKVSPSLCWSLSPFPLVVETLFWYTADTQALITHQDFHIRLKPKLDIEGFLLISIENSLFVFRILCSKLPTSVLHIQYAEHFQSTRLTRRCQRSISPTRPRGKAYRILHNFRSIRPHNMVYTTQETKVSTRGSLIQGFQDEMDL